MIMIMITIMTLIVLITIILIIMIMIIILLLLLLLLLLLIITPACRLGPMIGGQGNERGAHGIGRPAEPLKPLRGGNSGESS